MNTAEAAAQASTPSVKGGVYLDAFDARIIAFECALRKLKVLQTQVRALNIKVKAGQGSVVPLVHYVTNLCAGSLQMNERMKKRVESLHKLIPVTDMRKVVPDSSTLGISFALDDSTGSDVARIYTPQLDYSLLLEQLLGLCDNGVVIYHARLKQTIVERDAHRRPDSTHRAAPLDTTSFLELVEPLEVLSISKFVADSDELASYNFKTTKLFLDAVSETTQRLSPHVDQLSKFKVKPSEATLKRLPCWAYSIHRIVACVTKLSDLYSILRRFGRELYMPASQELHSPKHLYNNPEWAQTLNTVDDYFVHAKKNEQMLFTLAKVSRQGSLFQVKQSTVIELTTPLQQSFVLVQKLISVLRDLIKQWSAIKARENRAKLKVNTTAVSGDAVKLVSPDSKKLTVLFNPQKEKLSQENIAKQQRDRERIALEERAQKEKSEKEKQQNEETVSRLRFEERERLLRAELTKDRPSPTVSRAGSLNATSRPRSGSLQTLRPKSASTTTSTPTITGTRSRSASNASVNSNSSASSQLKSLREGVVRPPQSPTAISRSPSVQQRRPQSVYMSSPAFDIRSQLRRQEKAKQMGSSSPPTDTRLKRSSSLQQSPEQHLKMINAAAAGALKAGRAGKSNAAAEVRSSSLKTPAELKKEQTTQLIARGGSVCGSVSPPKPRDLPQISELTISTPPRVVPNSPEMTPSRVIVQTNDTMVSDDSTQPSPVTLTPTHSHIDIDATPSKSNNASAFPITIPRSSSPSVKPLLKTSVIMDPVSVPCLSSTSTIPESSLDEEPVDPQHDTTRKIVKKVRFAGVPDFVEEDPKPKRRGWLHPPKPKTQRLSNSNLSNAAATLQQERMVFSTIKRGAVDVNSTQMPERIMSSLINGGGQQKKGWRLGGRLRDRF